MLTYIVAKHATAKMKLAKSQSSRKLIHIEFGQEERDVELGHVGEFVVDSVDNIIEVSSESHNVIEIVTLVGKLDIQVDSFGGGGIC